jgi:hypothetical protein
MKKGAAFEEDYKASVFSRQFLTVGLDEVHEGRKTGSRMFKSFIALRKKSLLTIAISATPLFTSPQVSTFVDCRFQSLTGNQDLSGIGRIIGIHDFLDQPGDDQDRQDMAEVRKLQKDLKAKHRLKSRELQGQELLGQATSAEEDPRIHIRKYWMSTIGRYRKLFAGRIIRRSSSSLDNLGNSVMVNLPPLTNVVVPVTLPEHEVEEMHRRASEMTKQR